MILLTCLIAAKQLSSYPTGENKSFTLDYFFAEPHSLYSMFQSTTKILSLHDNVLKCTSSTQTGFQPKCNIGHQCSILSFDLIGQHQNKRFYVTDIVLPLRFVDAFFQRETSDDRKCVCCSQATNTEIHFRK